MILILYKNMHKIYFCIYTLLIITHKLRDFYNLYTIKTHLYESNKYHIFLFMI